MEARMGHTALPERGPARSQGKSMASRFYSADILCIVPGTHTVDRPVRITRPPDARERH